MKEHIITGKIGEALAIRYLSKKGYVIVEHNYKNFLGEIDIIARINEKLIFVEVKTSSSLKFGKPKERINYYKIKKLKDVATIYLKYNNLLNKISVRFDCIEIIGDKTNYSLKHIENIF